MSSTLIKFGRMALKLGTSPGSPVLGLTSVTMKVNASLIEVADTSHVNTETGMIEPDNIPSKATHEISWDGNAYASVMGAFDMAKKCEMGTRLPFEFVADSDTTEKMVGIIAIESIEIGATLDKTGTSKGSGKSSGHVTTTAVSA